ncbi:hypothetical protein [Luteitalea sp.]
MVDLPASCVAELRRLHVLLDHPDLAARAAGHRLNRQYTMASQRPRCFPDDVLTRYATTYARLLESALAGLLPSSTYAALDDYGRRLAIRDAQDAIARATDRAHEHALLASGVLYTWSPDDLPTAAYWAGEVA